VLLENRSRVCVCTEERFINLLFTKTFTPNWRRQIKTLYISLSRYFTLFRTFVQIFYIVSNSCPDILHCVEHLSRHFIFCRTFVQIFYIVSNSCPDILHCVEHLSTYFIVCQTFVMKCKIPGFRNIY
jgi:hypothetical protein